MIDPTKPHFAKPQPIVDGAPMQVYAKPHLCAVCGMPIRRRSQGGAWVHETPLPVKRLW